jgi:uncharacterized protein (AIM24 family)
VQAEIREGHAPVVSVSLRAGEELFSRMDAMLFMSGDVSMEPEIEGGLVDGLRRAALGGQLTHVRYTAGRGGTVGIRPPAPGSIRQHELLGEVVYAPRTYLAHVGDLSVEVVRGEDLGAGTAQGTFVHRLSGRGTIWLHSRGDFVDFDLAAGETMLVGAYGLALAARTVVYQPCLRGSHAIGTYLRGPGRVTVQTLPHPPNETSR